MVLDPWYVVGLVEGEGCFCITISKHKTKKLRFDARLMFEIEMIIDDEPLLQKVKDHFSSGQIFILNYRRYSWRPHVKYAVKSYQDICQNVIPFFEQYPLQGKKAKDFQLFCQAADLFKTKQHLTQEGLDRLRSIQSQMNLIRKLKLASARVRENRAPGRERR